MSTRLTRQPEPDRYVSGLDVAVFCDNLVGAAPDRRHAVQGHAFDHRECFLALDTEHVETGEQPFEHEPETCGALRAIHGFQFAAVPVPLDGAA
jgi:hypothetical protein